MFEKARIAPSLLSADFMAVDRAASMLEQAGADWLHVDVMDGHFVPNITMGVPYVSGLRAITDMPIDAHLMVSNPLVQIPWFADAGADIISFHIEAFMDEDAPLEAAQEQALRAVEAIREGGAKTAIAIKPKTPVSVIEPLIDELDMVLVMSVEPGFSGQGYIAGSEDRVAGIVSFARAHGASPLVQVDGGIGPETAPLVAKEGADVFVSGNFVLKAPDPAAAMDAIRNAVAS